MNNLDIVHEKILAFLVEVGFPQIKSELPLNVAYGDNCPVAYTTSSGIWIAERVIENCPEDAGVYFAHEVFHHVVDENRNWPYPPLLMNYAQDYRINYLLYKIFKYDVRKTFFKGLFSSKLGKMEIEDIAADLAKKNNYSSAGAACGYLGSSHPAIVDLADKIRTKYNLKKISHTEDALYIDDFDNEAYNMSGLGVEVSKMNLGFNESFTINYPMLARNLFALAFQNKPIAKKTYGNISLEETLVYGFLSSRLKTEETVDDYRLSAASVLFYLKNISNHANLIKNRCVYHDNMEIYHNNKMLALSENIKKIRGNGRVDEDEDYEEDAVASTKVISAQDIKKIELLEKKIETHSRKAKHHNLSKSIWSSRTPIQDVILKAGQMKIRPCKESTAVTIKTKNNRNKTFDMPIIDNDEVRRLLAKFCLNDERMLRVKKISDEIDAMKGQMEAAGGQNQDVMGGENSPSLEDAINNALGNSSGKLQANDADCDSPQNDNTSDSEGRGENDKGDETDNSSGRDKTSKLSGAGLGTGGRVTTRILDNLNLYESILFHMAEFDTAFNSVAKARPDENSNGIENMLSFGSDMNRVLPSEFAFLSNNYLKMIFFSKLADSSLLQYVPRANKREAVSIMVDCSGSMMTSNRYPVAAGFALSMMKKIILDQRGFNLIMFDTSIVESITYDLERGFSHSIEDIFAALCNPSQGGTCFDVALEHSLNVKEEMNWSHMTGILVSDGEDSVGDSAKERIVDEMGITTSFSAVITGGSTRGVTDEDIFKDVYRSKLIGMEVSLLKAGTGVL